MDSIQAKGLRGSRFCFLPSVHVCMLLLFRCYVLFDSAAAWTAAPQAPLSMEFSRQEYGSGLPFPPPGDLPDPGMEPTSLALVGEFFTIEPPGTL